MGMKLKQLVDKQPPYVINKSEDVVLRKIVYTKAKKTGLPAVAAHAIDPNSNNKGHACQIVTVETPRVKNPDLKTGWVKVSCDCDFFKYRCEYALSKHGAANIRYSNGEPAYTTNPDNYPLLCIEQNQLVTTRRGLVPIKDIDIGEQVLTKAGFKKVKNKQKTGENVPLFSVQTESGHRLYCTPDHLLLVVNYNNVVWKPAFQLKHGDYLPLMYPEIPIGIPDGDQSFHYPDQGTAETHITSLDMKILQGDDRVVGKFLWDFFTNNGRVVNEKMIQVFCQSESYLLIQQLQNLLLTRGIFATISRSHHKYSLTIKSQESTSRFFDLVQQKVDPSGYSIEHRHAKLIPINIKRFAYNFYYQRSDEKALKIVQSLYPYHFDRAQVQQDFEKLNTEETRDFYDSYRWLVANNVFYDEVKSCEYSYQGDVYDLTIEEEPNFIVSGMVVHNCKHLYKLAKKVLKS